MSNIIAFSYEYEHGNSHVIGEIEVLVVVSGAEVRAFELIDFESELDMLKTFFKYIEDSGKNIVVTHYLGNFIDVVKERVSFLELFGVNENEFTYIKKGITPKGMPFAIPLNELIYINNLGLPYTLTDLITNIKSEEMDHDLRLENMSKKILDMSLQDSDSVLTSCVVDAIAIYNIANVSSIK